MLPGNQKIARHSRAVQLLLRFGKAMVLSIFNEPSSQDECIGDHKQAHALGVGRVTVFRSKQRHIRMPIRNFRDMKHLDAGMQVG